jgi:AraC family transcriptional regulator of adaptative response/methylated-DNA-[protein]-cysteine methyltransferase
LASPNLAKMKTQAFLNDQPLAEATLFGSVIKEGQSGSGCLHNLFIEIERMTADELKNGSKQLGINFSFFETQFGGALIASTSKGICYLAFADEQHMALKDLKFEFPNATFSENTDEMQQHAIRFLNSDYQNSNKIKIILKCTDFQLKVWQALLKIRCGELLSYGEIAKAIQQPKASRAVGTAIGSNLIAFLIPCHRVIQLNGKIGGYRWGIARKIAIIRWELAQ